MNGDDDDFFDIERVFFWSVAFSERQAMGADCYSMAPVARRVHCMQIERWVYTPKNTIPSVVNLTYTGRGE
jgi:hypothetical protein